MIHRRVGFTLLELLVAVFVSAVLFALGYAALNQVIERRAALQQQQSELEALRRTVSLLTADLSDSQPRPVRDGNGGAYEPALRVDPRNQRLLTLTRGGRLNAVGLERPALQRVEWTLDQGQLWRVVLPTLESTPSNEPKRRALMSGVRALRLRAQDADGIWHEQWPLTGGGAAPPSMLRIRPVVIEVTLDTERFGAIVRLVELPT